MEKKSLIEEQSPCNHETPLLASQWPFKTEQTKIKRELSAMLLAFHSSRKSFQLLP